MNTPCKYLIGFNMKAKQSEKKREVKIRIWRRFFVWFVKLPCISFRDYFLFMLAHFNPVDLTFGIPLYRCKIDSVWFLLRNLYCFCTGNWVTHAHPFFHIFLIFFVDIGTETIAQQMHDIPEVYHTKIKMRTLVGFSCW